MPAAKLFSKELKKTVTNVMQSFFRGQTIAKNVDFDCTLIGNTTGKISTTLFQ